ncbi:MAG TPA: NfeD family protein [Xanthomonadales bacterium]|nr:NfeD family protein [Xanthomonadales bacterium]
MPEINVVYFWFGVALALMAAETIVPGAFLLWFGLAALVMGVIVLVVPDLGVLWQAIIFAGLSIVSVLIYRKFFRPLEPIGDQPLLNRKVDQMIGRTFVLHEPIVHGYGKIKVNDSLWKVTGPELPVGTKVQVMGADGPTLKVQETA